MSTKRILSLILAMLILLHALTLTTLAGLQPTEYNWSHNGLVDEQSDMLPGGVRIRKTATATTEPNLYTVTLAIESKPDTAQSDTAIAILLDISAQDESSGALNTHIQQLKELLPQLLPSGSDQQVALLLVNRNVQMTVYESAELNNALTALDSLAGSSGCFLEEGIRQAGNWLQQSTLQNKYLLMFSGGSASYSSKVSSVTSTVTCQSPLDTNPQWSFAPSYVDPPVVLGTGSSLNSGLTGNKITLLATLCNHNVLHNPPSTQKQFPNHHGQTAVTESQRLQAQGIEVLSVAYGAENVQLATMQQISSDGSILADSDALTAALQYALPSATDTLVPFVWAESYDAVLLPDSSSLNASAGTATLDSQGLIWALDEATGTLTYQLRLDVESPEFVKNSWYPLASGSFSYGEQQTIAYLEPQVQGSYSQIFAVGIRVNTAGEYLNEFGVIVPTREQAQVVAPPAPLLNSQGINRWEAGKSLEVPVSMLTPEIGYTPQNLALLSQTVQLPEEPAIATAYYYYRLQEHSYKIIHQLEDTTLLEEIVVDHVPYGTVINTVADSTLIPSNHARTGSSGIGSTITDNGTVITVTYGRTAPEQYRYRITPFLEGVEQAYSDHTATTTPVWIDPVTPDGYQLKKITFDGIEYSTGFSANLGAEDNKISVYFQRDNAQTIPYRIFRYFDGTANPAENFTVWKGDTQVLIQPEELTGYDFSHAVFAGTSYTGDFTAHITATQQEIHLYYTAEAPPQDDYQIRIDYYRDGEFYESATLTHPQASYYFQPDAGRYAAEQYYLSKSAWGSEERNEARFVIMGNLNPPPAGNVLRAYYHKAEQASISIAYYYDQIRHPKQTSTATFTSGTPLQWDSEWELFPPEYEAATPKTMPQLPATMHSGGELKVYYQLLTDAQLPYQVTYYKDGVAATGYGGLEQLSAGSNSLHFAPNPNLFTGYELDHLEFRDQYDNLLNQGATLINGTVTPWQNEVHVYYRAKLAPSYQYRVEYYYDGVRDDALTQTLHTPLNQPEITAINPQDREGYQLDRMEPELPLIITANSQIIRAYYKTEPVDPPVELPIEPPVEPPIEPPVTPQESIDITVYSDCGGTITTDTQDYLLATPHYLWGKYHTQILHGQTWQLQSLRIVESPAVSYASLGSSAILGDSGELDQSTFAAASEYSIGEHDSFTFRQGYFYQLYLAYTQEATTTPQTDSSNQKSTYSAREVLDQSQPLPTTAKAVPLTAASVTEIPPQIQVLASSAPGNPILPLTGKDEQLRIHLTILSGFLLFAEAGVLLLLWQQKRC